MCLESLERSLDAVVVRPRRPAHIEILPDGESAWLALEHTVASAAQHLDILVFLWESDEIGERLARLVAERAAAGVAVRILVDGGGNLIFGRVQEERAAGVNQVLRRLADTPGVEVVRGRNPFGRFDHRKLVLADKRIAWTGGRNVSHAAFQDQRDVSLWVQGPIVADLADLFETAWADQGGAPTTSPAAEDFLDSITPNARARLVETSPRRHDIEATLFTAIDHARDRLYIENFAFCDGLLLTKLANARRRGVDVRVVTTLAETIKPLDRANRVAANRLLAAGVRVYLVPGMTHAKVCTIDGCWAYVGSANFDPLSLRCNRELGLAISDGPTIANLEREFLLPGHQPDWELTQPLATSWADWCWEILASACL
jgi:cardiolipin synthase